MLSTSIGAPAARFLFAGTAVAALLTCSTGHAQGVYALSTSRFAPPPVVRSFHVAQVLDLRPDRSRLGVVRLGLDNRLVPANFEQPLDDALGAWLRRTEPAANSRPVVLRIHSLRLDETVSTTSETASAELVADFLVEREPGVYYCLLPVGMLLEQRGLEVTKKHAANLEKLLQQAVFQLTSLPDTAAGTGPALSLADVQAGRGGSMAWRYPVQQAPLRRGVYRSFDEFRANAPGGTEGPFVLTRRPRTAGPWAGTDAIDAEYLYLNPQKPRRPVRGAVWGLCDGTTAYFYHRGAFYELTPSPAGAAFSLTLPAPDKPDDIAAGMLLGGLLGAGLASALSGGEPLPCTLHLASGRIEAHPTTPGPRAASDSATVYLYRRPDAAADRPMTVMLNGQAAGTLASGSYLALRWGNPRQDMHLCLQVAGGPEHCQRFVPSFTSPSYVQCSVASAVDSQPCLTVAPEKEGVFYVKKYRLRAR